eukprot:420252-Pelagomonas_calceolata.AAC.2
MKILYMVNGRQVRSHLRGIVLGTTRFTGRRNVDIPSILLNFESVGAKAKSGHTAHDVFGQIQVQILG